jgi:HAD superfamily hydrolase (TIGR01493 family)
MAENAAGVSASRPLLEGALLNEYRFKWAAFPAVKGYLRMLDAVLSVEDAQVYKPHPAVYQLAKARLVLDADEICFISSNGWDGYCAKAFGFGCSAAASKVS